MYVVADNMKRLDYIAEMPISFYTDDDIEYMNHLLNDETELLSEGAALTLHASCKYLILQIASEYQDLCYGEPFKIDIPKEVRLTFFSLSRKRLPELLKQYSKKYGDIDRYIARNIAILYEKILNYNLGIDFMQKR